jgi:hypothetical protein
MQPGPHIGLARHPEVDLVNGIATGELVPERIEEVRAALEDPHPPPLARMQARQRRGDGGLALA